MLTVGGTEECPITLIGGLPKSPDRLPPTSLLLVLKGAIMGNQLARELADNDMGISLDNALAIHLQSNHYPPVPLSMVPVCLDAIDSYNATFSGDELIELPEGVSWKGKTSAPAWAIIEAHHLDAWCDNPEDYYDAD